jgi:hypothetical protein
VCLFHILVYVCTRIPLFNLLLIHVAIPKRHNDLVCRVMSMIDIYDYFPISEEYYLKEKENINS